MDPTTWNSYQIVSNRARAMCYAAQQTQFRKMTELTVNQLVAQAGNQLATMKDLQVYGGTWFVAALNALGCSAVTLQVEWPKLWCKMTKLPG